jgi:hypothetical protein
MRSFWILCTVLAATSAASGYIHKPPTTLAGVCKEATWVRILTVKACNKEKGAVSFEVSETLRDNPKWKSGVVSFRMIVPADAPGGKSILKSLEVGKTVVLFSDEGEGKNAFAFGYACLGKDWYSVHYNPQGELWLFLRTEAGLTSCYYGEVKELRDHVRSIHDGKDVKVPTRPAAEKVDLAERAKQIDAAMKKNRAEK